jgi:hypothetical protein
MRQRSFPALKLAFTSLPPSDWRSVAGVRPSFFDAAQYVDFEAHAPAAPAHCRPEKKNKGLTPASK